MVVLSILTILLLTPSRGQCLKPLEELVRTIGSLDIVRSFLSSNCSTCFNYALAGLGSNVTLFAPTDEAWNATFNMTGFTGFDQINCSGNQTDCARLLSGNTTSLRPADIGPCLPLIAAYHVGAGSYREGGPNGGVMRNITVLPSAMNSTLYNPEMPLNMTQYLVLNSTKNEVTIQGGGNSTAIVVAHHPALNGHLDLIDHVLLPPFYLNDTLTSLNFTQSQSNNATNATTGPMNMTLSPGNITVFVPDSMNLTMKGGFGSLFNISSYIVPQVIYLNQTQPITYNLTTLNGDQLILDASGNSTGIINGNVSITRANIPLVNGVLHLVNDTLAPANISNTYAARSLRQNLDHWRRWIVEHS